MIQLEIKLEMAQLMSQNGPKQGCKSLGRPGPAEIPSRAGPVMPNFISIRIFKRFFKENLNFIINSFQIKPFYLKK